MNKRYFLLFSLMVAGFCLSFSANHSCSFVKVNVYAKDFILQDQNDTSLSDVSFTNSTSAFIQTYGIWRGRPSGGSCTTYSNDQSQDAMWKTARLSGTIADILGITALICMIIYQISAQITPKIIILLCFFCSFFQCATYFFLRSNACKANDSIGKVQENALIVDGECLFAYGAKSTIVGITFWLMTSLILTMQPTFGDDDDIDLVWESRKNQNSSIPNNEEEDFPGKMK